MKIRLSSSEVLADYGRHLKRLDVYDTYTRFGYHAREPQIDDIILNMLYNPDENFLFTAYEDGNIIGYVQLSKMGDKWELAVSVEKEHQNKGVADQTIKYAISWAKTHNIETIFMNCIAENRKIQHLARKYGLKSFERDGPDITAGLKVPEATPFDYTNEWLRKQQEILNQIIKLQNKLIKNIIPNIKG